MARLRHGRVLELDAATGEPVGSLVTGFDVPSKFAVSPGERRVAYLVSGQNALFVGDRDEFAIGQVSFPPSPIGVEIVGVDPSLVFGSGFEIGTLADWTSVTP